jgi:hypothetical protein
LLLSHFLLRPQYIPWQLVTPEGPFTAQHLRAIWSNYIQSKNNIYSIARVEQHVLCTVVSEITDNGPRTSGRKQNSPITSMIHHHICLLIRGSFLVMHSHFNTKLTTGVRGQRALFLCHPTNGNFHMPLVSEPLNWDSTLSLYWRLACLIALRRE